MIKNSKLNKVKTYTLALHQTQSPFTHFILQNPLPSISLFMTLPILSPTKPPTHDPDMNPFWSSTFLAPSMVYLRCHVPLVIKVDIGRSSSGCSWLNFGFFGCS